MYYISGQIIDINGIAFVIKKFFISLEVFAF